MSDELGRLSSENRAESPSFSSSCSSVGGCSHWSARSVGDYLLVSQLGDDALGSVYRALHTGDSRSVRLRLLQSPERGPRAVLAAVRQELERNAGPSEPHRGMHISDGKAYRDVAHA